MSVYNFFHINHASVRMQNTVWEQSYIPDHPTPLILGEPGAARQDDAIFRAKDPGAGKFQPRSQGSSRNGNEVGGNPHAHAQQ